MVLWIGQDDGMNWCMVMGWMGLLIFYLLNYLFFVICSISVSCPQRSGVDLREDIITLIKFWQAIFQDRKSLTAFSNVDSAKPKSTSVSSDLAVYSVRFSF